MEKHIRTNEEDAEIMAVISVVGGVMLVCAAVYAIKETHDYYHKK
jgi:hypothetical protein